MSGRRHRVEDRQVAWHFSDPEQLFRDEEERGDVVFEAPEAAQEGGLACWSCGQIVAEGDVVTSGPGTQSCPGCGARLPFA